MNRLLSAVVFLLILLPGLESALAAPSSPPGEILSLKIIEGEESGFCSEYLNKSKTEVFFLRRDGEKIAGKSYWSIKSAKKKSLKLKALIINLDGQSDAASKKKLQKVKADKKLLGAVRKHLKVCTLELKNQEPGAPVQFKHVEPLLQNKCMNCHGVLGWENSLDFFVQNGYAVPGDLEASPLYAFLANNPEGFLPATMPKGLPPLNDAQLLLLRQWIMDIEVSGDPFVTPTPTPTPSGPAGEGAVLYQQLCSSCHGDLANSTKINATAEQIRNALQNIPQMAHLQLTDEQIQSLVLALASSGPPVIDGDLSIRSLGAVSEGNPPSNSVVLSFELEYTGTDTGAFSIGYVTSNGTALAGSDYLFQASTVQFSGTAGEKHTIEIPIYSDSYPENDETLFVDIGGLTSNRVQLTNTSATGTIQNDDSVTFVQPPQVRAVRLAYNFNNNYEDSLGMRDAQPQADVQFLSPGRIGNGAVDFDSAADHLIVPTLTMSGANSITVAMWVYWRNSQTQLSRVFDFGQNGNNYLFFSPRDGNSRCRFEARVAGTTYFLQCPQNIMLTPNQWVHVSLTYDASAGEMKIFFDGIEMAVRGSATADFSSISLSSNFIGRSRAGNPDFDGMVDEFMIWSQVLSQAEIQTLAQMTESSTFNSGLQLLYQGQVINNGSSLNLEDLPLGEEHNISLLVRNMGPAALDFTSMPNLTLGGPNAQFLESRLEPFSYQQSLAPGSATSVTIRYAPSEAGDHSATVILPNSDVVNGNLAVAINAEATGTPLPTPTPGTNPELEQGIQLYNSNCYSCHGSVATSTKRGVNSTQLTNAFSTVPQMQGINLSPAERDLIVLALNSPIPASNPSPAVTGAKAVIGTGSLVFSKLSNIFLPYDPAGFNGTDTAIQNALRTTILGVNASGGTVAERAKYFGGSCQELFDSNCSNELRRPNMTPPADALRYGLTIRACQQTTENTRAIDNMLSKVGLSVNSAIDDSSITLVFSLFAPGRDIPEHLMAPLTTFTSQAPAISNQTDAWRTIAGLLCESMIWEG